MKFLGVISLRKALPTCLCYVQHMYMSAWVCMYVSMSVFTPVCVCVLMYLCVCMYVCVCVYVCVYVCMRVCMYVCGALGKEGNKTRMRIHLAASVLYVHMYDSHMRLSLHVCCDCMRTLRICRLMISTNTLHAYV
jgi:hypothetical protein